MKLALALLAVLAACAAAPRRGAESHVLRELPASVAISANRAGVCCQHCTCHGGGCFCCAVCHPCDPEPDGGWTVFE